MASLSEEDVKSLYRCEKKAGRRELLAKLLNFPEWEKEEDDTKLSVLLDFYLESVHFAAVHGFSWQQGLAVFELMTDLLNNTLGLQVLQATEYFKTIIKTYIPIFQPHRLRTVIDFVFLYFFNHFNLFKFVFNNEQQVNITSYNLVVETPPQDLPALKKGMEKSEWEQQQQLRRLDDEHKRNLMEKQLQLNSESERIKTLVRNQLASFECNKPLTTEELKHIVEETVKTYVSAAGPAVQHLVAESQEKLIYEFDKMALGQELGKDGKTATNKARTSSSFSKKKKQKGEKG